MQRQISTSPGTLSLTERGICRIISITPQVVARRPEAVSKLETIKTARSHSACHADGSGVDMLTLGEALVGIFPSDPQCWHATRRPRCRKHTRNFSRQWGQVMTNVSMDSPPSDT